MSHGPARVAYFCMEFGLSETFPVYAGGLGILAGDFMRSAKALGMPMVGVGIFWANGYTKQSLGVDGAPLDNPVPVKRDVLIPEEPTVKVTIADKEVVLKIWRVEAFDNARLYLLEPADEKDRHLTDRLYGGGKEDRIAQEIILGKGGVRALEALGIPVDLYHFNEGHALFAGLELVRREREAGLDLDAAMNSVRRKIVFTTHTPVEAGNETHANDMLAKMSATVGFSAKEVERIGGNPFNMTVAALRLSGRANAVAELHGVTARKMWKDVKDAAPIDSITNGVDHRFWQDAKVRDAFDAVDADKLRTAHESCKLELLSEIEQRTNVILHPDKLLIGFARRATGYKRATLFFNDMERAHKLLGTGKVQLLYAGKAHPHDYGGQSLIQELVALSHKFPNEVVFLPDYEMHLGRLLTRGCDIWMNTPRRPLEACGTSGMKAAMNGVLNMSILDGWWPEGCVHGVTGWQIGSEKNELSSDKPTHKEEAALDEKDAAALYNLLENEVLPTYYEKPSKWVSMMRASIEMSARFSADRMLRDYYQKLYAFVPRKAAAAAQ